MSEQTALYRFYDTGGQLLYVGITRDPPSRFAKHGGDKNWWDRVAGITIEWCPSREAALDVERRAIIVEHPLHNVVHNRPPKPSAPPKKLPSARSVPKWLCDECGSEVRGTSGYIHVSYSEIDEHQRSYQAFQNRQREEQAASGAPFQMWNMKDFMEVADEAPWRIHHRKCDPRSDSSDYWFDVERAATWPALLGWTAHLLSKNWLNDTNWDDFLRRSMRTGGEERALNL